MKIQNVPQEDISTYDSQKKAIYATDENGNYSLVASSGWEVEGDATKQAIAEFESLAKKGLIEARALKRSPLYFHMYDNRMDLAVLAQSVGMFKWRVKRHLDLKIFNALSVSILNRYADALGIELDTLKTLPPT